MQKTGGADNPNDKLIFKRGLLSMKVCRLAADED